ncbi:hypothetical protein EB796_002373 [Bugula neritina]|uniref:Uncharacterized protein n=1 Tax=Bugula neritina TaxID=10212 RepID=A0A7J7KME5_BUGNE|nr:hypothetical protein EB796_002373 [Bugula neritina]
MITVAVRLLLISTSKLNSCNMASMFTTSTSEPSLRANAVPSKFTLLIIKALPLIGVILKTWKVKVNGRLQ